MNKKAQLNTIKEAIGGFQAMFAFILVAIIMSLILVNFYSQAIQEEEFQTDALSPTMLKMQEYPVYMDWGAFVLYAITLLASIALLYLVDAEPLLYLVSWIGLIALSVAIIGAGYALEQFVNSTLTAGAVANMIFIPFYASNAFIFALIYFFACAIALHAPRQ
jgi:hypothetical protein